MEKMGHAHAACVYQRRIPWNCRVLCAKSRCLLLNLLICWRLHVLAECSDRFFFLWIGISRASERGIFVCFFRFSCLFGNICRLIDWINNNRNRTTDGRQVVSVHGLEMSSIRREHNRSNLWIKHMCYVDLLVRSTTNTGYTTVTPWTSYCCYYLA